MKLLGSGRSAGTKFPGVAEITAVTGKDPGVHYQELTAAFGTPYYTRIDAPATVEQKAALSKLAPDAVQAGQLAGEPIHVVDVVVRPLEATALITGIDIGVEKLKFPDVVVPPESAEITA